MAAFLKNNRPVHPIVHHWFIIFHFQLGSNPSHCRPEMYHRQGQTSASSHCRPEMYHPQGQTSASSHCRPEMYHRQGQTSASSHCRPEMYHPQGQNIRLFTLPTGNGSSPGPKHPPLHIADWKRIIARAKTSASSHCRLETDHRQGQNIRLFTLLTKADYCQGQNICLLLPLICVAALQNGLLQVRHQIYCFTGFLEAPLSDPRCFSHLSVLSTCTAPAAVPQEPNNTVLCLHFTAGLPSLSLSLSLSRPEWFPQTRDFQSLYCATYNTVLQEQMLSLDCIL